MKNKFTFISNLMKSPLKKYTSLNSLFDQITILFRTSNSLLITIFSLVTIFYLTRTLNNSISSFLSKSLTSSWNYLNEWGLDTSSLSFLTIPTNLYNFILLFVLLNIVILFTLKFIFSKLKSTKVNVNIKNAFYNALSLSLNNLVSLLLLHLLILFVDFLNISPTISSIGSIPSPESLLELASVLPSILPIIPEEPESDIELIMTDEEIIMAILDQHGIEDSLLREQIWDDITLHIEELEDEWEKYFDQSVEEMKIISEMISSKEFEPISPYKTIEEVHEIKEFEPISPSVANYERFIYLENLIDEIYFSKQKEKIKSSKESPFSSKVQSRKYHSQILPVPQNNINWKFKLYVLYKLIKLLFRISIYITIIKSFTDPSLIPPSNTLQDQFLNALDAALEQEILEENQELYQDTQDEAYELAAITINNSEGIYNLNYFDETEIFETSTPIEHSVPNNSFDNDYNSDIFIETDTDYDLEVQAYNESTGRIAEEIKSEYLSEYYDSEDSDWSNKTEFGDSDREFDSYSSSVSLLPLLIITTINPKNICKIRLLIILIIYVINIINLNFNSLDLLNNEILIIDMTLEEFNNWIWDLTYNKPLPELPSLIDVSILPYWFLPNKIMEKFLKDFIKILINYLSNIICSLIVNRTSGLLGASLLTLTSKKKGKQKVSNYFEDTSSTSAYEGDISDSSETIDHLDSSLESLNPNNLSEEDRIELIRKLQEIEWLNKMKLKNLNPNSIDSELTFIDPYLEESERYRNNPKLQLTREEVIEFHNRTQEISSKWNFINEESLILANSILSRENKRLLEIINRNNQVEESSIQEPSSESDLSTSSESDYGEVIKTIPSTKPLKINKKNKGFVLTREERLAYNKPLPPIPESESEILARLMLRYNINVASSSQSPSKNKKMLQVILTDRWSHTPTEDTQLRTPWLDVPKTAKISEFDFELESDGDSKPLIKKESIKLRGNIRNRNNEKY